MKHRRTAKELLVHFLKAKADAIFKFSKIVYLDAQDYNEVLGWSEEQCLATLRAIVKTIAEWDVTDSAVCPWCAQLDTLDQCTHCAYAQRHKPCTESGSRYQEIRKTLQGGAIVDIPKVQELCERYISLFKLFLKNTSE